MAEIESIILEHLRAIRSDVARLREDMGEVKQRLTALELGQAAIRRDLAALAEADAHINARLDRLDGRVTRIETRLELHEIP